ncbi:alpha/beta fold hydrolase [Kaistella daneshvariae]|uniref:alpha/beta fold hydrolase n=1 Tax=Kaistella daneshvariae TaxID=2487074 RepID=UPI0037424DF8
MFPFRSFWAVLSAQSFRFYGHYFFSDTRGHGESETTDGDYSAELLGNDILELIKILGIKSFNFCGLSMGGLIGQWLGFKCR